MNTVVHRSVKVGLLATALVGLGTGVASARGTSPGSTSPSVTKFASTHPQYVVKRGPVGTVIDAAARQLHKLAPSHGMQPMNRPAPAAPSHRYVAPHRPATPVAQPVNAKEVITKLKRAVQPAAAPAPTSPRRSGGCKCGAQITLGPPTTNTQPAAVAPGASVGTGDPVGITVPVTNNGPSAVSSLAGTSSVGDVTCADTSLAADQTTCTTSTTALDGANIVPLTVDARGPVREPLTATRSAFYVASRSAPSGHGTLDPGTPTVNGDPADTAPGPQVDPGVAAMLAARVTNNGDAVVTDLAATSAAGSLSCASTTLAPGQTTMCTESVIAGTGDQTLVVTFTGQDPNGALSATTAVHYTGGAPGTGTGGNGSTGRPITVPGSGSPGSGSGPAVGASGGSVSVVPSGAPETGGGVAPGHGPRPWLLTGLLMISTAGFLQAARRRWDSRP